MAIQINGVNTDTFTQHNNLNNLDLFSADPTPGIEHMNTKFTDHNNIVDTVYAQKGEKPDFLKEIVISQETNEMFEQSKTKLVDNAKIAKKAGIILLIGYILANILPSPLNIILIIVLIVGALFNDIKRLIDQYKNPDENPDKIYIDNCLYPIMKQYDEDIVIRNIPDYIPVFGTYRNYLTDFLYDKHLCKNADGVEPSLMISDLTTNKNGFYLCNFKAYRITHDSDGHRQKSNVFKGTLIGVRMAHSTRADVSLFTSQHSSFLGIQREQANGYKPIRNTIDTENEIFNQNFEVDAEDQTQAFFILTPIVMENLLQLKEKYGKFGVYIHDDFLLFCVNSGKAPLSRPESLEKAEQMNLQEMVNDTVNLLQMIYELKDSVDLVFDNPV